MNSTNNISARMTFEQSKKMFFDAWLGNFGGDANACQAYVDSRKLSQSEIRLEVGLLTTASTFVFGVTPNQANTNNIIYNTENRLQMQDSLIVSEYGIFIGAPTSLTDTTFRLNTYANGNVNAIADVPGLNSTFYSNSFFTIKVNNDVVLPFRGLFNHFYVPQTQQIAPSGITAATSQLRGAEDGFVTQEPNLLLIGSKNNVPSIVLPAALASVGAFVRCVLIFRGILAQNSTVIN